MRTSNHGESPNLVLWVAWNRDLEVKSRVHAAANIAGASQFCLAEVQKASLTNLTGQGWGTPMLGACGPASPAAASARLPAPYRKPAPAPAPPTCPRSAVLKA
eukprot:1161696-Pelagomonas_calceolata.AAC.6